jgi:hypothetical protein
MAWDHDGRRIAIVRHTDRSKALRPSDSTRDVAIAPGLAIGNGQEGLPARQLKVRPAQVEWKIELPAPAKYCCNSPT